MVPQSQTAIWNNYMWLNLLDQREKDLRQGAETVLLAAVKHVSSTAQSSHFVHQTLLTTFLQHELQHLRDGGLACTRLLKLSTRSEEEWKNRIKTTNILSYPSNKTAFYEKKSSARSLTCIWRPQILWLSTAPPERTKKEINKNHFL